MTAGELCNREVVIVSEEETVLEAARRMREFHVGDLVVVKNGGSPRPIGVITDRDLVVGVLARDVEHLDKLLVGDVMSRDPVTAHEDDDLETVIDRMRTRAVRRVPVLDDAGVVVGILTVDEVLEFFSEELSRLSALLIRQRERERTQRV